MQMCLKISKKGIMIRSVLIHLVDEQKCRDLISFQEPPQRHRMALHAVHAVDHKNRIVQHLQCPLHLSRKIDMPRSIQKCYFHILGLKDRLLGKDRDPTLFFQFIIIQKGISVIHASDLTDHATQIQESFGQSRLPGIYMRQDSYYQFFHVFSSFRLYFSFLLCCFPDTSEPVYVQYSH